MISIDIPGRGSLSLEHVVFDVNGTLTSRGKLIAGVRERVRALAGQVDVQLASADTFGTLDGVTAELGIPAVRAASAGEKFELVRRLGAAETAVVGNGSNDVQAMRAAALGVAVLGGEGASGEAIASATLVCVSILDALDLLLDPRALVASLRR